MGRVRWAIRQRLADRTNQSQSVMLLRDVTQAWSRRCSQRPPLHWPAQCDIGDPGWESFEPSADFLGSHFCKGGKTFALHDMQAMWSVKSVAKSAGSFLFQALRKLRSGSLWRIYCRASGAPTTARGV